jgi:hypothetical protein
VEATAYGGGLHSIYGTNALQRQLLSPSPDSRAKVAGAFGKQAEQLAYNFSLLDRPRCLDNAASFRGEPEAWKPGRVFTLAMRYGNDWLAPAHWVRELCLIEAANLLDQDSLDKWPRLKALWEDSSCGREVGTRQIQGPTNAPRPFPPA